MADNVLFCVAIVALAALVVLLLVELYRVRKAVRNISERYKITLDYVIEKLEQDESGEGDLNRLMAVPLSSASGLRMPDDVGVCRLRRNEFPPVLIVVGDHSRLTPAGKQVLKPLRP